MGKTPKPLMIVVTSREMRQWPEIEKLAAQQHSVVWAGDFAWDTLTPDIVMGPNCHRMSEQIRKWFPAAITEARRLKYPGKPGAVPEEDHED